jgi:hypothetical protein
MCKTKYRPYFILLLMSMFGAATAPAQQDYRYQAPIPQVSVAGFYKISLPEELISRCAFEGNRPRDIRLFSRSGSIVPYIFEMDQPILQDNSFTVLPTIDSLVDDKSRLSVVVQNTGMLMRDALVLVIRNTEVCQSITLSGSDDNKQKGSLYKQLRCLPVAMLFFGSLQKGKTSCPSISERLAYGIPHRHPSHRCTLLCRRLISNNRIVQMVSRISLLLSPEYAR